MSGPRRAIWVSTSTRTRGGIASYVRGMQQTPLWSRWSVRHVATHQDGSVLQRMVRFARGGIRLWLLLLFRRPALVHLHTASRGSFIRKSFLAWSTRAVRVPVVLHVHGGGFTEFYESSPRFFRRYIRATLEMAGGVVALGPSWAEQLQRIAPEARIVVVPNAVAPHAASRNHPAPDGLTVLFLGRVSEDKGAHVLLRAWSLVVPMLPAGTTARLVLAGDGELEPFRHQAADLGASETVDFLGWVSAERVDTLLAEADVLVLPSRWEGHPMSVLEAMARGIPVVVTAVGGVPDLVDRRSGILIQPDDVEALAAAVGRLLSDVDLRDELGAAGLQRVRDDFDIDKTWRTLDALYEELAR